MTFVELQEKWSQMRVESDLEKVYGLISSSDEGQVGSSFSLLISLGDCALCAILHEVDGQLRVREDVVVHHRLLWEKCILAEVMVEESVWNNLYRREFFLALELRVHGNIAFGDATDLQCHLQFIGFDACFLKVASYIE